MNQQQQMSPDAMAAIQAAQAQMQAQGRQPQRKPDNEFSVQNFINFLEGRLKDEHEITVQNTLNKENLAKILEALKAIP